MHWNHAKTKKLNIFFFCSFFSVDSLEVRPFLTISGPDDKFHQNSCFLFQISEQ